MDWQLELVMAVRAVLAAILGGIIGFERELHKHDAGIRTYAAVAVGSCVFGLVSMHSQGATAGDSRISAQIVSGIGFICAGVIMRGQGGRTIGLTTAATIWATASIGLTMAYGMYVLGVLTTIITFFLLAVHDTPYWKKCRRKITCISREARIMTTRTTTRFEKFCTLIPSYTTFFSRKNAKKIDQKTLDCNAVAVRFLVDRNSYSYVTLAQEASSDLQFFCST